MELRYSFKIKGNIVLHYLCRENCLILQVTLVFFYSSRTVFNGPIFEFEDFGKCVLGYLFTFVLSSPVTLYVLRVK